jgi:sodium transport system permease protein
MTRVGIIFRKELKDMLRDRRTIFFMIVFPILIIPLLIGGIPKFMTGIMKEKMTEKISIAIIGKENSPDLMSVIAGVDSIDLVFHVEEDSIETYIRQKEIDGALKIPKHFTETIKSLETAQLTLIYLSTGDFEAIKKRLERAVNIFVNDKRTERMEQLGVNPNQLEPVHIAHQNIASDKEKIGKIAGGWLPYMFILYCFMGAMYPALDLGAGEKERGTIETLLTSPAGRMEILLGKFGVISLFGFLSAISGILGLVVGLQFITDIPAEIIETAKSIIQLKTITLILLLIVPVSILFSAVLLSISIYAKSFKEAQSLVAPINILIIVPAMIGVIPGIELNWKTALIPIVNISLISKDILAETVTTGLLFVVFSSMILLAVIGLVFTHWWFNREEVIFRD